MKIIKKHKLETLGISPRKSYNVKSINEADSEMSDYDYEKPDKHNQSIERMNVKNIIEQEKRDKEYIYVFTGEDPNKIKLFGKSEGMLR